MAQSQNLCLKRGSRPEIAREETAGEVTKLFEEHGGGFGQGLRWEWHCWA
jgi:hypothetical protein